MLAALVGCGGDGPGTKEAALTLGGADVGLAQFTFDDTRIGATTRATFTIANEGDAASGTITAMVTGEPQFAIAPESTCPGQTLAAGSNCTIAVAFVPTALGSPTGTLQLTASPGGSVTLGLAGTALPQGLAVAPMALDFGVIAPGDHHAAIDVTNLAADALPITAITIDGAAFTETTTCGGSLAPGAHCAIDVTLHATALGVAAGTLTLDSQGTLTSAPLAGVVGGEIAIIRAGGGTGTVAGGGLDCGAVCMVTAPEPVTLTAAPDAGSSFVGWSESSCGAATTCTIEPAVTPRTVTATFAPAASSTLAVTFAGDGQGEVGITRYLGGSTWTPRIVCNGSCAVPVESGDDVFVEAGTRHRFDGFTGACTVTNDGWCRFSIAGDSSLTATFSTAPEDLWNTLLIPGGEVMSAAFDSQDRLVLGTTAGVVALNPDGTVRWQVGALPSPTGTGSVPAAGIVRLDGDDNAIVAAGTVLAKLGPTGAAIWSIDLGVPAVADPQAMAHSFAVARNGDVALQLGDELRAITSAGAMRWSVAAVNGGNVIGGPGAVAIDSTGRTCTLINDPESTGGPRSAVCVPGSGGALSAPVGVAGESRASLAFGPDDHFVTSSFGGGSLFLERRTASGALDFYDQQSAPSCCPDNAVAVAANGTITMVYEPQRAATDPPGFVARWFTPSGAIIQAIARPSRSCSNCELLSGIEVRDFAIDHQGRTAIVGRFAGATGSSGIVEVLRAP